MTRFCLPFCFLSGGFLAAFVCAWVVGETIRSIMVPCVANRRGTKTKKTKKKRKETIRNDLNIFSILYESNCFLSVLILFYTYIYTHKYYDKTELIIMREGRRTIVRSRQASQQERLGLQEEEEAEEAEHEKW